MNPRTVLMESWIAGRKVFHVVRIGPSLRSVHEAPAVPPAEIFILQHTKVNAAKIVCPIRGWALPGDAARQGEAKKG